MRSLPQQHYALVARAPGEGEEAEKGEQAAAEEVALRRGMVVGGAEKRAIHVMRARKDEVASESDGAGGGEDAGRRHVFFVHVVGADGFDRRRRGGVADAGLDGDDDAVGPKGGVGGAEGVEFRFGVMKRVVKDDGVEFRGGFERFVVGDLELGGCEVELGGFLACGDDGVGRDVDAGDVIAALREAEAEPAGAATEVEEALGWRWEQVEERGEIGEVEAGVFGNERFAAGVGEAFGADAREVIAFALFGIGHRGDSLMLATASQAGEWRRWGGNGDADSGSRRRRRGEVGDGEADLAGIAGRGALDGAVETPGEAVRSGGERKRDGLRGTGAPIDGRAPHFGVVDFEDEVAGRRAVGDEGKLNGGGGVEDETGIGGVLRPAPDGAGFAFHAMPALKRGESQGVGRRERIPGREDLGIEEIGRHGSGDGLKEKNGEVGELGLGEFGEAEGVEIGDERVGVVANGAAIDPESVEAGGFEGLAEERRGGLGEGVEVVARGGVAERAVGEAEGVGGEKGEELFVVRHEADRAGFGEGR